VRYEVSSPSAKKPRIIYGEVPDDIRARLAQPALATQMPVIFPNGNTFKSIVARCCDCHTQIDAHHIFGSITRLDSHAVRVEGAWQCPVCALYARCDYRHYDDGRMAGIVDGRWLTMMPRPAGRLSTIRRRLWQALRWLFWLA